MIVFPNAKINLGLRVINKRPDGFHNIESYMIPVDFCDALEIVPSADGFQYSQTGLSIDTNEDNNLVIRAYELMREKFNLMQVKIHLHKNIPIGTGLGGGSADGAFTLSLLRRLFDLRICNNDLEESSAALGSDCPFFIINKAQKIEGKGTPTRQFLRLPSYFIVIVLPDVKISTAFAYSIIKPSNTKLPEISQLLNQKDQWKSILINDFEEEIFKQYPSLASIKQDLYNAGAFFASMSGSGSSIYGLFEDQPDVTDLSKNYMVWQGRTIE